LQVEEKALRWLAEVWVTAVGVKDSNLNVTGSHHEPGREARDSEAALAVASLLAHAQSELQRI
jgi:hypothetical protein